MKERIPPKLAKLSTAKQRRLDELLDKNSEGTITPTERTKLGKLVAEAEQVMVANVKLLAEFSEGESAVVPTGAVPVTVWVKPEQARR